MSAREAPRPRVLALVPNADRSWGELAAQAARERWPEAEVEYRNPAKMDGHEPETNRVIGMIAPPGYAGLCRAYQQRGMDVVILEAQPDEPSLGIGGLPLAGALPPGLMLDLLELPVNQLAILAAHLRSAAALRSLIVAEQTGLRRPAVLAAALRRMGTLQGRRSEA